MRYGHSGNHGYAQKTQREKMSAQYVKIRNYIIKGGNRDE